MNEMTVFQNPDFGAVRSLTMDGEPWFVGRDVATALGYKKPQNAILSHVDDEDRALAPIQGGCSTGTQQTIIINESGLYSLILSSKLPDAKKFKRWVTSEVLPAIRKTGRFAMDGPVDRLTPDDYIRAASIVAKCNDRRLPVALKLLETAGISPEILKGFQKDRESPQKDKITADELVHLQTVLSCYTVRQAAELVNLSPGLISFYRRGLRLPSRERYGKMIEILE